MDFIIAKTKFVTDCVPSSANAKPLGNDAFHTDPHGAPLKQPVDFQCFIRSTDFSTPQRTMKTGKYLLPVFHHLPALQRRSLLFMNLCVVGMLLYLASYAVLRLNGYFIRGINTEYGRTMYAADASWDSGGAAYLDGNVHMWGASKQSHLPLHALRFYSPIIRAENLLRVQYGKYRLK